MNQLKDLSENCLVSIIINCYNSEHYLEEAIDSLLTQTYQNWEVIFWDNQSTDNSARIFNKYKDSRLRYFYAPKFTKLGEARNLAVSHAKGDWLGFLDCDDVWLPIKLESQINIVNQEISELGIVYGQCLVIKSGRENLSRWSKMQNKYIKKTVLRILPEGYIFKKLIKFNFIPLVTAIVNKSAYHEVGGVSSHFEHAEDYELFIKIAATKKVRAVQKVVALYRIHEHNISINNEKKSFDETLEIIKSFSPNLQAKRGLSYQNTLYALSKIRNGNRKEGLLLIANNGSAKDCIAILLRKITKIFW